MKFADARNKQCKDTLINLGFKFCGADGYICHLSHYKNDEGAVPCNYCPRKKYWEENGCWQLPDGFRLSPERYIII